MIAKTSVLFDVKPWDDETDMDVSRVGLLSELMIKLTFPLARPCWRRSRPSRWRAWCGALASSSLSVMASRSSRYIYIYFQVYCITVVAALAKGAHGVLTNILNFSRWCASWRTRRSPLTSSARRSVSSRISFSPSTSLPWAKFNSHDAPFRIYIDINKSYSKLSLFICYQELVYNTSNEGR